jgi:hypothetical protein
VALPTFVCSFARSACDLFDPSAFVETCPVVSYIPLNPRSTEGDNGLEDRGSSGPRSMRWFAPAPSRCGSISSSTRTSLGLRRISLSAPCLSGGMIPSRSTGQPRPTLIVHTGFDGTAEEMPVSGARAAVERGYSLLAFDGPGQYPRSRRAPLSPRRSNTI